MLLRKTTLLLALLAVLKVKVKVRADQNEDLLRFGAEGSNDGELDNLFEDSFDGEGSSSGGRGLGDGDHEDGDDSDDDTSEEDLAFVIDEGEDFQPEITASTSPSPVLETTTSSGLEEDGVEKEEEGKGTPSCSTDEDCGSTDNDVGIESTIKTTTLRPEIGMDCHKEIDEHLKGEYGTCEKALNNIQSVTLLLKRVSEQGLEGPKGLKGSRGDTGEKGLSGSVVFKGQKGSKGEGVIGRRGPMGPPGAPGYPGSKGDRGPVGPTGYEGIPGQSIVGPAGTKGEKGECIETRVPGPPGPQGKAGIGIHEFNNLAEMFKMHQMRNPVNRPHVDRSQSRRAKLSSVRQKAKQRQRQSTSQDEDGDGDENEIYNDPPMTPTTEASIIKLNRTLFRIPTRLRLVSLNSPWSGNMHGIDHINYQCQKEAMDAKLTGIFRTFLSTTGVNITSLIHNRNDTIANLYNNTLYESKRLLFRTGKKFLENKLDSLVQNGKASLYSFDGRHVILDPKWEFNMLWHGAHIGGRYSRRNCQNWTTNNTESLGIASDFLFKYILDQKFESCSSKLIVLCIELSPIVLQEYLENRPAEYLVDQVETKDDGDESSSPSSANFYIGEDEYKQFLKEYYDR